MNAEEIAPDSSSTLALIARYRDGDSKAASELFDRYVRQLDDVIRTRIHPDLLRRFGPEDILQSAFRSLFRSIDEDPRKFERSGELWAWLFRIAINKLASQAEYHRAAMRSIAREEAVAGEFGGIEDAAVRSWTHGPLAEDVVAIADELDYLFGPPGSPMRVVVDLRLQGQTLHEMGARLGVSHTTVLRRLKKIRAVLAARLREIPGPCDPTEEST